MTPRILTIFPPNYRELRREFGAENVRGAIFAYGAVIYNPHNIAVTPDLMAHETEHCNAQLRMGAGLWWERYAHDRDFRLTEELLGHRAEYAFLRDDAKLPADTLAKVLQHIARRLSGPLYGNMIGFEDAKGEITR